MRIESAVTSVSWIPSEAVTGAATRIPFDKGITNYDPPPPEQLSDLAELSKAGRFRFANHLAAYVEVEDDRIVGWGQSGRGHISSTKVQLSERSITFRPVALPDLRPAAEVGEAEVRFFQTTGGRTGLPAPRRVRRAPFVQFSAPLAWTTLALTIRADGTSHHELVGASSFPRHWIYDADGRLAEKSGLVDFSTWWRRAFGRHSPWGDEDSEALTTEVESALERQLSASLMGGADPEISRVSPGTVITEQGSLGEALFLVLDGVVRAEVDGARVAEYGPGSLHGERAIVEHGRRTATLRAVTACTLAIVPADRVDRAVLAELSKSHRNEDRR